MAERRVCVSEVTTKLRNLFIPATVVIIYVILGGLIFNLLEGDHEKTTRREARNLTAAIREVDVDAIATMVIRAYKNGAMVATNSSHKTHWDVFSSMFFAATVVTTIGYGNTSPATYAGRVFFVFYAIAGIPLCLVLLANIGAKLSTACQRFMDKLKFCEKRPKLGRMLQVAAVICVGLVLLICVPAIIFTQIEGWDYGSSLYYCVVSLSTIGFGDYVPGEVMEDNVARAVYRISTCFWFFIGLAWLSGIIAYIQQLFTDVFTKSKESNNSAIQPFEM